MRKRLAALLLCLFLILPAARAEDVPFQLVHEALLSTCEEHGTPIGAAGWFMLGQEKTDREWALYLAASVGRYGFMGGYCTLFSGWGGPCTVILQRVNGDWALRDVLVVEDYSEIPDIMPAKYAQKFFDGDYDALSIDRVLEADVLSQRDALGRAEPLGSHAQAGGELPDMLTVAANLLMALDDWPLGCTQVEREEAEGPMLYSKAWEGGVPAEPITVNGHPYDWGGVTGVLTCVKTNLSTGEEAGRVTAQVTMHDLTIRFQDAFGSITYALPLVYGGTEFPHYEQPTVTREGRCRMDVEVLERYLSDLPGTRHSEWEIEAQTEVSDTERFTLWRNCCHRRLRHEVLRDGAWQTDWENARFFPNFCEELFMDYQPGVSQRQESRLTREADGTLRIWGGEESATVYVSLSRSAGEWVVDTYENKFWREFGLLTDDALLVQDSPLVSDMHALYVPGGIERRAAHFDHEALWNAREPLTGLLYGDFDLVAREHLASLGLVEDYADIAGAEVLYAVLGVEAAVPVYAAPSSAAPRAAGGKAAVSLKDAVAFLCREGDWLMVLYETGAGKHRTGWVSAAAHPALAQLAPYVLPAHFEAFPARVLQKTNLLDDPLNLSGVLCALPQGTPITVLDSTAALWYVEASTQGKTWRGYVESSQVEE